MNVAENKHPVILTQCRDHAQKLLNDERWQRQGTAWQTRQQLLQ